MSAAFGTQAFQQSRHARRIYVGGFPPNYGDEEALKFFLNSVIAKGLGEPNDNSYVLSIYVNQKKCFAFVELRAIELATACLDLDGIIYKKVVLKVLRANEYKPELIPPSMVGAPITLDLSSFSFGIPAAVTGPGSEKSNTGAGGSSGLASSSSDNHDDARMDSVIQFASLSHVFPGTISIIGYPFDDRAAHSYTTGPTGKESSGSASSPHNAVVGHSNNTATSNSGSASTGAGSGGYTGLGCTQAPKKMRNLIRKYKFGLTQNPEYEVDLTRLKYVDLGDVQVGKTREETKLNLSSIVGEVIQRHAVPFVIGGSSDCGYFNALGVMAAAEARVGMVVLSAQIDDTRVLDDGRFCPYVAAPVKAVEGSAIPVSLKPELSLTSFASHSESCVSVLSDPGLHENQPTQQNSEVDSSAVPEKARPSCGGRYVRFAAQGSQVNKVQSAHVLDKDGHIVWLSKDIRNQSPACSVLPTRSTSTDDAEVQPLAVPHLHTLKLFQQALRCAAGLPAHVVTVENVVPIEDPALPSPKALNIYRQDSQDTCDTTAPGADVDETPFATAGLQSQSCPTPSHAHNGAAGHHHQPAAATPDAGDAAATASAGAGGTNATAKPEGPGAVMVSIDMGVMSSAVRGCGYITGSSSSTTGLSVDEILDIVMIAGADPNVISLDISEFSPDAEDTRSNMLLAQMFYQFSLGVATRPSTGTGDAYHATKVDRRGAVTAGVEVEAHNSSFVLTDASYMARMHINTERMEKDMSTNSRTPKYYQEISSGSMEGHITGHPGSNAGDAAAANATQVKQPYVEVDHRFSSMDAMDGTASTDFAYSRSGASASASVSSKQGASSPTTQMHNVAANFGTLSSASSTDTNKLYPNNALGGQVLNQRVNFPSSLDTNLMNNLIRTSPSVTPNTSVGGVRRGSASSTSPPIPMRTINPGKIPTVGPSISQLYPASVQQQQPPQQRNLAPQSLHLSPQHHQQMLAQQQAAQAHHLQQQQQQQVYGQRPAQQYRSSVPTQQSPVYPPQAHSPQYGRDTMGGYPQQQQQQQRLRYDSEQLMEQEHLARHAAATGSVGWNHNNDRAPELNRYHHAQAAPQQPSQQMHRQTPQMHQPQQSQHSAYRPSPMSHSQQLDDGSQTASYLSTDFLDITGERIPNAGVAAVGRLDNSGAGGYGDRLHGQGNQGLNQGLSQGISQGMGQGINQGINQGGNRLGGGPATDLNLSLSLGVGADLSLSSTGSVSSDKSRSLIRTNSNLSSSSLGDIHAFDESLDLHDYRLTAGGGGIGSAPQHQQQQRQAPGPSRNMPPPIPQYQQQASLNRAGYPGANTHNIYSLYGNNTAAALSTDSLAYSTTNTNSSMNSDIMAGLAGLTGSGSGSTSNASSMLFRSPSPLGGHSQGPGPQNQQQQGGRQDHADANSDFMQDHYSQFT